MPFHNRQQAGRLLAERLSSFQLQNPVVIALPRGGVTIGCEVARVLGAPLEVLVVRKVGAPGQPELGIGAVTEDGDFWIDAGTAHGVGAGKAEIEDAVARESREVRRRVGSYRHGRPLPSFSDRTVVLVDDGLATGGTARVACRYLKKHGALRVILAVPVSPPETARQFQTLADDVLCLEEPTDFASVSQFYEEFEQLSDEEVIRQLEGSRKNDESKLLTIPASARGLVIFAHGSGSSRLSPRNQLVARALRRAGFGTLLFDLLSPAEAESPGNVFDIPLLARRLAEATEWARRQPVARSLPIGYFGASTGAAAALWAASEPDERISAVVSRGGRPDLALTRLPFVSAPTLLIVGSWDEAVLELNREALRSLSDARLEIIPNATHLFEEPGTLEAAAKAAVSWFTSHLGVRTRERAA